MNIFQRVLNFLLIVFPLNLFAGGHGHGEGIDPNVWWHAANLVLFFLVIYLAAGKKIAVGIKSRAEEMEKNLIAAQKEEQRLEKELAEWNTKIKKIEQEKNRRITEADKLKDSIQSQMKEKFLEEELRLKNELKRKIEIEQFKQFKAVKESIIDQAMQMSRNELVIKSRSKDIHFDMRQEIQENFGK